MGAVVGNYEDNHSGTVYTRADGKYGVPLTGAALEYNRFEHGTLWDGVSFFTIESNTGTELVVTWTETPPQSDADIRLWDDDSQVMPHMPDTSQLSIAMTEAFVDVRCDIGGSDSNVPFAANLETPADRRDARDWDTASQNSTSFWVAYVLGAYQDGSATDNDPDSEGVLWGVTCVPAGGSLIFLETSVDAARELGTNAAVDEQDTVVHEVGHAVSGNVSEPVTRYETGVPSRYTEDYLLAIRSSGKPLGP